jgi:hypothetical protein
MGSTFTAPNLPPTSVPVRLAMPRSRLKCPLGLSSVSIVERHLLVRRIASDILTVFTKQYCRREIARSSARQSSVVDSHHYRVSVSLSVSWEGATPF